MRRVMRFALGGAAAAGAVLGTFLSSLNESKAKHEQSREIYQHLRQMHDFFAMRNSAADVPANVALNHLASSNQALIGFVLTMHERVMNEMVFDVDREDKDKKDGLHEISCRSEFVDDVRKFVNADCEEILKEVASWAHSIMDTYSLKLDGISLETDRISPEMYPVEVLLVFHVNGKGDDALRFQSDASRLLRETAERRGGSNSHLLRAHVRWK
ncbi:hypothetical protein EBS67_04725 [bacterium]|nr:hypothetical protein [bacterium]